MKNLKLKRIKNLINPLISIKWGHSFYATGCCFVTLDPRVPTRATLHVPKLLCKSQLETNLLLNNCSDATFLPTNSYLYRKKCISPNFCLISLKFRENVFDLDMKTGRTMPREACRHCTQSAMLIRFLSNNRQTLSLLAADVATG